MGEAEAGMEAAAASVRDGWMAGESKETVLARLAEMPGVLVPGVSRLPVRRVVAGGLTTDLEAPCYSTFVSSRSAFRDMFLIEVNRGCRNNFV